LGQAGAAKAGTNYRAPPGRRMAPEMWITPGNADDGGMGITAAMRMMLVECDET
jgi:hypothetical protein